MSTFAIGSRMVGGDAPVFIVAELSANHGQKRDVALRTIEAAARSGADAIKLQTYTPDTLTLKSEAPPFVVRTKNEWQGRSLYDLYQEAMTPWEWHGELFQAAAAAGLICFSTPFDATAVEFLEHLGVVAYKVASFELTDLPLVERIARTGKPVILSTGMASLGEIEAAVATCREAGNDRLALLRCVSSYPARPESMGLATLAVLRSLGAVVGLSDHTRDSTVAVAAAALGAKIIEKHFILDRSVGGPDAFFSLEPDEFQAMVQAVRDAEKAVGVARFGPSPEEVASTAFRRSLFVARDLAAGEVLTCDSVRSVRPANGMSARHLPTVLGRTAACSIRRAEPLTWEMVGPRPTGSVHLRNATMLDADQLFVWRNDPVTRQMSIQSAEVSVSEHAAWLRSSLESTQRAVLIAESQDLAVGVVRLERQGSRQAEVSLTLAPASRGKGLAASVLEAAESVARERGDVRLVAKIKAGNLASIRVFKKAGYYGFTDELADRSLVKCERRIAGYL
jgi:pseudaminic acid synthase